VLHWVTAVIVIGMIPVGIYMANARPGPARSVLGIERDCEPHQEPMPFEVEEVEFARRVDRSARHLDVPCGRDIGAVAEPGVEGRPDI